MNRYENSNKSGNQLRAGLFGFGKAGRAVATVLLKHPELRLEWIVKNRALPPGVQAADVLNIQTDDPALIFGLDEIAVSDLLDRFPVDVIIDFSSDDAFLSYGAAAAERGISIVSAVSHYPADAVEKLRSFSNRTRVFWSPNITLGVNFILFAATFLKEMAPFVDIEIVEEHFKNKAGVSGTALKLAEALDVDADQISSIRAGGIVGRHEVIFGFPFQTVRLIHESITREAFGTGAVFVAQNLHKKPAGWYQFEDLLRPYFTGSKN